MRPTLKEIADGMDLSRERIRQIEEDALEKIRSSPVSRDLLRHFKTA
jgi:DNA-directed RNA polymerase sigma subunit (sigma70/sigma32)